MKELTPSAERMFAGLSAGLQANLLSLMRSMTEPARRPRMRDLLGTPQQRKAYKKFLAEVAKQSRRERAAVSR